MKSFGTQEKKDECLKKIKYHQDLDAYIQGSWLGSQIEGNGKKGCFYGCTMQTDNEPIRAFSEYYQVDLKYCYLTEKIYEGLPSGEYQKFPYQSTEVIPVDFDFNTMWSRWHTIVLTDQLRFVDKGSDQEKAIVGCIELFKTPWNIISESAARSAAESAAWSAAWSAESAESAESAHYMWLRDKLFELIKES